MNKTIPDTKKLDMNIFFINSTINNNLEYFQNEKIYNLIDYFEKNPNLISIFIKNVFDNENFFPSEVYLEVNENIIDNVNIIQNEDPHYEFSYLYSFLKHPIFQEKINEFKNKRKSYNYSENFNPIPIRRKRSIKKRCRSIAEYYSLLGNFKKKITFRDKEQITISKLLKYRKQGYQKVQKV